MVHLNHEAISDTKVRNGKSVKGIFQQIEVEV